MDFFFAANWDKCYDDDNLPQLKWWLSNPHCKNEGAKTQQHYKKKIKIADIFQAVVFFQ